MHDLIHTIKKGAYGFEGDEWQNVSDDAKDLITRLIVVDPSQRLVPSCALKHPWLKDAPESLDELKSPKATLHIQKNLKKNKRRLTKSKLSVNLKSKRMSFNMDIRGALESQDVLNALRIEQDNDGSFTDSDPPSIEEMMED